ncbi:unnamed protein product [Amoebophrya sp. A25]|nr:unnamed protein product [Amoebophrya sp. A25]|eukprot:GSA25T00027004001.1
MSATVKKSMSKRRSMTEEAKGTVTKYLKTLCARLTYILMLLDNLYNGVLVLWKTAMERLELPMQNQIMIMADKIQDCASGLADYIFPMQPVAELLSTKKKGGIIPYSMFKTVLGVDNKLAEMCETFWAMEDKMLEYGWPFETENKLNGKCNKWVVELKSKMEVLTDDQIDTIVEMKKNVKKCAV